MKKLIIIIIKIMTNLTFDFISFLLISVFVSFKIHSHSLPDFQKFSFFSQIFPFLLLLPFFFINTWKKEKKEKLFVHILVLLFNFWFVFLFVSFIIISVYYTQEPCKNLKKKKGTDFFLFCGGGGTAKKKVKQTAYWTVSLNEL